LKKRRRSGGIVGGVDIIETLGLVLVLSSFEWFYY
jgi:hypothetical protein